MLSYIKHKLQGKLPGRLKRSSRWRLVRKNYLQAFPKCAICGGTSKLEVHHIIPFHIRTDLELVWENLITLCESKKKGVNCHLFFGHLGNYKDHNSLIDYDVTDWSKRLGIPDPSLEASARSD